MRRTLQAKSKDRVSLRLPFAVPSAALSLASLTRWPIPTDILPPGFANDTMGNPSLDFACKSAPFQPANRWIVIGREYPLVLNRVKKVRLNMNDRK